MTEDVGVSEGGPGALTRKRRRALRALRKAAFKLSRRSAGEHGDVGAPFLAAMKRRFQLDFLTSRGLTPENRLLDIGCGSLRGGVAFIEYLAAGGYTGIEARAQVLEVGRKELHESNLDYKRPVLICAADPAEVQLDETFDFAWAFMVLIHMPDDIAKGYMDLVSRSLAPGGTFYANVQLGNAPEKRWAGFPVVSRPLEFYARCAEPFGLTADVLGTLESLGHRAGGPGDDMTMLRFARA